MYRFSSLFAANTISLWVCASIIPGISYNSFYTLIVAGLLLTILNNLIRPMLLLITLPITIASLGLFTLILNGFVFFLVSKIVTGFAINTFWAAVAGAIVTSVVNFFFKVLFVPQFRFNVNVKKDISGGYGSRGAVIDAEIVEETKKLSDKE